MQKAFHNLGRLDVLEQSALEQHVQNLETVKHDKERLFEVRNRCIEMLSWGIFLEHIVVKMQVLCEDYIDKLNRTKLL